MTGLVYPDGYAGSTQPHCGVLALAMCVGVSFETAWATLAPACTARDPKWTGRTYARERRDALQTLGVGYHERLAIPGPRWAWMKDRDEGVDFMPRCTVATFAKKHAEPGVAYMVNIKGHVLTLRDGLLADQFGLAPVAQHGCARSMIIAVIEISK